MSAYNSTPTCDADENYKRAKERVKKISEEKLGIENQLKTLRSDCRSGRDSATQTGHFSTSYDCIPEVEQLLKTSKELGEQNPNSFYIETRIAFLAVGDCSRCSNEKAMRTLLESYGKRDIIGRMDRYKTP